MSEDNRYAAPKAEVADVASVSEDQLRKAHKALNQSRMSFVVFFIGFVAMGYIPPQYAPLALVTLLVSVILAHVFLGCAAARSGRNWLWFALLPVLAPVLGGLISFGVLCSKVPYADA